MPLYDYFCPANGRTVEVFHGMNERILTWGELCGRTAVALGDTSPEAPVEKLIAAPGVNTPVGDSKLKNMGFTKLVKRDKGVYENVTATGSESRYMKADDPSTLPHLSKKIRD
ncbi:MAG: zinc ribbon domain-containing protein [Candidatus Sumerlaeia bacterium]|nr:zinc ribbon domain-containing protein [Candidatus Sumerlaeia bacterium]